MMFWIDEEMQEYEVVNVISELDRKAQEWRLHLGRLVLILQLKEGFVKRFGDRRSRNGESRRVVSRSAYKRREDGLVLRKCD